MQHLLVRISTIGVSVNAPICNVGVISFDPNHKGSFSRPCTALLNWKSQIATGKFKHSPSDLDYWRSINKADQSANLKGNKDLGEALDALSAMVSGRVVWTPQASFHALILMNAYEAMGINAPWELTQALDATTLKSVVELNGKPKRSLRDYAKNKGSVNPNELLIETASVIQHLYTILTRQAIA